jgi:hypothetical protein
VASLVEANILEKGVFSNFKAEDGDQKNIRIVTAVKTLNLTRCILFEIVSRQCYSYHFSVVQFGRKNTKHSTVTWSGISQCYECRKKSKAQERPISWFMEELLLMCRLESFLLSVTESWFVCVAGCVSQTKEASISLSPSDAVVESYLSSKHIVSCTSQHGEGMRWIRNATEEITASKGRCGTSLCILIRPCDISFEAKCSYWKEIKYEQYLLSTTDSNGCLI